VRIKRALPGEEDDPLGLVVQDLVQLLAEAESDVLANERPIEGGGGEEEEGKVLLCVPLDDQTEQDEERQEGGEDQREDREGHRQQIGLLRGAGVGPQVVEVVP
jgi:hypothetical protein